MSTVAEDVAGLDATAQAALVRTGEVDAVELVRAGIERIEALNPTLNAVITPTFERALDAARVGVTGPFAGVPFLLKDLAVEMEGVRFCEGSRFLGEHVSTYESELVTRFRRAGLVILGKTNTPEFGMAPACEPERFGPTRNPWDPDRSTSGSSGGSAAAVASRMVPMAHADDLGGSIRYPASACGLFGLKPTRARVSYAPRYGDIVHGWGCEFAVTRSVRDAAALLDAVAGSAPGDPYVAPPPVRAFSAELETEPRRLRIAYSPRTASGEPGHDDCIAALDDTVALLDELGHEMVEADVPAFDEVTGSAIGTVFDSATAWIVAYWVRELGREPQAGELEPLTRHFWEQGRAVPASAYLIAVEELQRLSRRIAHFLDGFDSVLTPTLSEPPARIGEITSTPDAPTRALERGSRTIAYSGVIANFTGNPAMSVPLSWNAAGLPIGVQFLGRFGDEATLLQLAGQLERARPWADRVPPISAARGPGRIACPTHHRTRMTRWTPRPGRRCRSRSKRASGRTHRRTGDAARPGPPRRAGMAVVVVPSTVPAMTEQPAAPERGEAESRDVAELLRVLDLEELDRDIFRGVNPEGDRRRPRLFGGQVAAQAARAASLTVPDDRSLHSLHGYFLRAGRADRPTILHVDRDRDGGSYSARHVAAVQDGEVIMSVLVSFHADEDGPEFQALAMPDGVPPPEAVPAPTVTPHASIFDLRIVGRGEPAATSPGARTGSGPGRGARSPRTHRSTRACSRTCPTSGPDWPSCRPATRRGWVRASTTRSGSTTPAGWTTGCSSTSCRWPRPAPAATTPAPCTTAPAGCWRRSRRST